MHQRTRSTLGLLPLVALAFAVSSCAANPDPDTGSPNGGAEPSKAGLHYYLPKDELEVQATRTTTTRVEFDFTSGQAIRRPSAEGLVEVGVRLTADRSKLYPLDLSVGGGSDSQLTVEQEENGLLAAVNASSTGRAGDTLRNVFRFVTTLVTAVAGGPLASGESGPRGAPDDSDPPVVELDPVICEAADVLPTEIRDRHFREQEGVYRLVLESVQLPDPDRLVLSRDAVGCEIWQDMLVHDRKIAAASSDLDRHQEALARASADQVDALMGRIEGASARLVRLRAERREQTARFESRRARYLTEKGLRPSEKEEAFHEVFELAELPSTADLVKGEDPGLSARAVRLFETTGFLISIDAPVESSVAGTRDTSKQPSCGTRLKSRKSTPIYYRMAVPRTLTVWKVDGEQLVVDRLSQELMVDPQAPVRCLLFEKSAWANRSLAIAFGSRGQPVRVDRSGTSGAAAVTAALADAAITARDTYVETLGQLATAEEHKRSLELADLNTDVERLQKEKELLDAEISLEGTAASRDLLLRQSQLDTQLAVLERELELRQAQDSFDSQLQLARLELELAQLRQQLEILQTRMAITEAGE